MAKEFYDVVVVGAGNAALCAALSAREYVSDVLVLERAPQHERGGNSQFTAGAMRSVYNGVSDIETLVELSDEERAITDFGQYTADQYFDDMGRVTQYRCDPDLVEVLVNRSLPTLQWMKSKGVRFVPIYGRQAFKVDGRFKFWGGIAVEVSGGGPGLVNSLHTAAELNGVEVRYQAKALSLLHDDNGVTGVQIRYNNFVQDVKARSVVLAAGGFEANAEWRTRYLGPGWDLAKVRGSRFNTGDGIRMALDIGASPAGNWSGCHAVAWDRNAPEFGDLDVGDQFQKHSYPWGIVLNSKGERFLDEGAEFRNYTYAKYGREILSQPGQFAWQVFDAKVAHLLRNEYRIREVTKIQANTIEELASKMDDTDQAGVVATINKFNNCIRTDVPFDPNVKDGRCTEGLTVPKSNWANTIDEPPFEAFAVTCGITFTFGGLRVNPHAQVIDNDGHVIPGLYAAGELVGGLFYFNYPGGTGLTAGSVFGRIAGASAAGSNN